MLEPTHRRTPNRKSCIRKPHHRKKPSRTPPDRKQLIGNRLGNQLLRKHRIGNHVFVEHLIGTTNSSDTAPSETGGVSSAREALLTSCRRAKHRRRFFILSIAASTSFSLVSVTDVCYSPAARDHPVGWGLPASRRAILIYGSVGRVATKKGIARSLPCSRPVQAAEAATTRRKKGGGLSFITPPISAMLMICLFHW